MIKARYRRITLFFARILLGLLFWEIIIPRIGLRSLADRTRKNRLSDIGRKYRTLAVKMGGVLIKVGQFLSARVDILPIEFTSELEGLQDEVPPERIEDIQEVVFDEFGETAENIFDEFDPIPLASASIGQVHRAVLIRPDLSQDDPNRNVKVVVKIQRPGIELLVKTDLSAIDRVGSWLTWYAPIRRRADIPALLSDFSKTLYEEMDYLLEGEHAEEFAANFADNPLVVVPKVAWNYTTRRVITLEDVWAIKITDYKKITAADIDRKQVASLLFETYLQQIFKDSFFHADPHPGNLFVMPVNESGANGRAWKLAYIDFGMMGRITPEQREGLREMAIAVTTQNAARAVKAYNMLGFLLPGANLELIEKAGIEVFERFWGKSTLELRDISFSEVEEFTQKFRELMYDLPFQVPEDLILLGRAVAILSGMCSGLDPDFNVWHSLLPYARELMQEESSQGWEFWRKQLVGIEQNLLHLPGRVNRIIKQLEQGELISRDPQLTDRIVQLEKQLKRLINLIFFASLFIGGILLYTNDEVFFATILLVSALTTLIWTTLHRN